MTTELEVYRQKPQELTQHQVNLIANTEFVPKDKRNNVPAIWAAILTGREIGLGDMTAIREVLIIDGRPSYSAALSSAIVRKHGHSLEVKLADDGNSATAKGVRADNGDTMTFTFTHDMAVAAGLAGRNNWKHYKHSMLLARAATQVCRTLFSDCFMGGAYTSEELAPDLEVEADELLDDEAAGVLTEPDIGRSEASVRPLADARATGDAASPASDPGSVSSWADLGQQMNRHGITAARVNEVFDERFPGREKRDLSPDEIAVLWAAVTEKAGVPA